MARNRKFGASPAVQYFVNHTSSAIVQMIDDHATGTKKDYKPAVRVNKNIMKRKKN